MPLATTPAAAATAKAAVDAVASAAPSTPPLASADAAAASTPLSTAAMETVKRRSLQLSSDLQEFVAALARKDSPSVSIPLELKLLAALVVLFLFLVFLVAVLWDRYGKEIGELYTPNPASGAAGGDAHDAHVNAVADEYTVYQKLPTFFYEYMPRKKQQ